MVMERSGQHIRGSVPEGKQVADGAGVYFYLFLCLFAACFFPPVRGFSEEWLRPKWVLAEAVGLLVLLTFGIQVLVACRHRGSGRRAFGWWGRVEDAFCEALVGVAFLEAVYAIVRMFRGGQEGMATILPGWLSAFVPLCRSMPVCGKGTREGFGSVLPLPYVLWSS